jgi:hypothetical protein
MTNTGAAISRFLVSPNGEDAKKALLKVGECRKANSQAGVQVGEGQQGAEAAEHPQQEHNDDLMDLNVALKTNVFPLWSEYPQLKMVRDA